MQNFNNNINKTPYINQQNNINGYNFKEIPLANQNNYMQEETMDYTGNHNNTITNRPLLPMDNAVYNEDDEDLFSEEIKQKSNLLFEEKQVSAFKLYLHLSEPYEILLMILGTIAALAAGVAAPLMCYFFGDMANDFSSVNVDDSQMELLEKLMDCKNQDEINALAGGNSDKIWIIKRRKCLINLMIMLMI